LAQKLLLNRNQDETAPADRPPPMRRLPSVATIRFDPKQCLPESVLEDTSIQDEELAGLAWALAHPIRVRIVRILVRRQSCVCGDIVAELPLAQSTVSQHLRILKGIGIIQGKIDGPKVHYSVAPEVLNRLKTLIAGISLPHESGFQATAGRGRET